MRNDEDAPVSPLDIPIVNVRTLSTKCYLLQHSDSKSFREQEAGAFQDQDVQHCTVRNERDSKRKIAYENWLLNSLTKYNYSNLGHI